MATAGDELINSSTTADTERNSETFCSPCQSDGKRLAAIGYCETCKASLCERCFDCHTVPIPMRNHRLMEREKTAVETEVNKDTSQCCPMHEGEVVLYHCPSHSFLGCHICCFQHQKTCREVIYIPAISETFNNSDELKEFMLKLDHIAETSTNLLNEHKHSITLVEKCHTDSIAAIKAFKLELLEAIDQLEKDLCAKAKTIMQEGISELNSVVDKCLQYQTEIQAIASEMETVHNKNRKNDIYISMVKSKDKLLSLQREMNTAKGENPIKYFKFDVNAETRETLQSQFGLGKLWISTGISKAEYIKDINVKRQDETSTCYISGSAVLPEHKLILADHSNHNIKIIDTKQQKVLSSMPLSSAPWSLAKVTDNTVAVALPGEKKIVFIRTDPALSIDKELGVDGACYGVAYNDGKLVVGFSNPKVEIMDMKGSVLRRIQADGNGQALFHYPYYIAINPERSLIYVSNSGSHKVVCLRFDGTVVATFKDNELQYPRQVIVDSTGNVYVCCDSKNVHQMTEDCKKIKVLLTSADGLSSPFTISYEETEGNIYVGEPNCDNIKVYHMNYEYL